MAVPVQGIDDGKAGYGVFGESTTGIGVEAPAGTAPPFIAIGGGPPLQAAVKATSWAVNGYGVLASSTSGEGVWGDSAASNGVHGVTGDGSRHPNPKRAGVWGDSDSTNGVYGSSAGWNGVEGDTWSPAHAGIAGQNNAGGPGVWGFSAGNAGQFEGHVLVTGTLTVNQDILLPGADCAEEFDVAGDRQLEPGTVVVIDQEGALRESRAAYDRKVAGVVSGAGEYKPAIVLDRGAAGKNRK